MINKILIANRGEIALRIARTCREMGIKTVAIYSDLDRKSPFVYFCDEAYALNGTTSVETYLRSDKILDICLKTKADAVHPGYGFLSENSQFAKETEKCGVIFIGPSPEAIRIMGQETEARRLMREAGVPVVPGTEEPLKSLQQAQKIAQNIGYPLLIKASAGGGGKGMRLVNHAHDLKSAMEAAQREAKSAFGNSSVYIEKYVTEPRHIEFQILADSFGNVFHLGERECSIQRRHQKIIEESPSVFINPDLRAQMGEAAINAAKACDYKNAGTIEFLMDKDHNFYFLEMNTRLQVEHPVTEMVTGLDLVKEQILIAAGEKISVDRNLEKHWGHAIECRIYAENSDKNFAPSPGIIRHILPPGGPGVREDSGVSSQNEISLYYDPMISKLITWAPTRNDSIQRMIRALSEYELQGIHSTIPFLLRVLNHPRFVEGNYTTDFINEEAHTLHMDPNQGEIAAFAAVILEQEEKNKKKVQKGLDNVASAWKINKRKNILR